MSKWSLQKLTLLWTNLKASSQHLEAELVNVVQFSKSKVTETTTYRKLLNQTQMLCSLWRQLLWRVMFQNYSHVNLSRPPEHWHRFKSIEFVYWSNMSCSVCSLCFRFIQLVEMLNELCAIRGRSLYECISEGNCLSSEMFRWHFFLSCLRITHIKVCFVYSGNQVNAVSQHFVFSFSPSAVFVLWVRLGIGLVVW